MDTAIFKSFNSISEFNAKTANHSIFIKLSNGWYVPVTKKAIGLVAKSMKRENIKFSGKLTFCMNNAVQAEIITTFN